MNRVQELLGQFIYLAGEATQALTKA